MAVYVVRRETSEEFSFDPDEIRELFGEALDAWTDSFDDFVISLFAEHHGSQFGNRIFSDEMNFDLGLEVIERGDED